ncbi:MAG: sulfatase, partial [Planctomycetota bacterium]
TPNIDRLAEQGLRFDRAFCTNSICAPARAVVLTGKHSHLNGVRDNEDRFDPASRTFPKLLQAAGYRTALFGKWHLKSHPTGFDEWQVLDGQGQYYQPEFFRPDGAGGVEKVRYDGHATEVTTRLAIDWLEARAGGGDGDSQPFLLMLQHKAPHRNWMPAPSELGLFAEGDLPEPATLFDDYAGRATGARDQEMTIARHMYLDYDLQLPGDPALATGPDRWAAGLRDRMAPDERAAWDAFFDPRNAGVRARIDTNELAGQDLVRWKYQRYLKNYLRCIAGVDRSVGEVLEWLEAHGLAENTLVIYTSDQGFYLGEHGWYDKRWMYEPSLRFPLVMRWPAAIEPGRSDGHLVQNLDFAPTLLEVCGAEVPGDMQGQSLVPLLRGEPGIPWRDAIYYEYFEVGIHNVPPHYGVRTDRYKLIHYPGLDAWELFDLKRDPDELRSRYGETGYAKIQGELVERLQRLREEVQR